MSRLIDADEFQKQIVGMAILNNYPPDKANALCKLVDSQPTAFDVEKVLNELKHKESEALRRYSESKGTAYAFSDKCSWDNWRKPLKLLSEVEEMKNKYSKKQLEELYNCEIFKDTGFDSCTKFLVAQGLPFTEDGEDSLFTYADGWDLDELHENIREAIRKSVIVFEGE